MPRPIHPRGALPRGVEFGEDDLCHRCGVPFGTVGVTFAVGGYGLVCSDCQEVRRLIAQREYDARHRARYREQLALRDRARRLRAKEARAG